MPSKTIDEILKNIPPESRAAIEKMSPALRKDIEQTGQGLQKQGIAEKAEYQNTGRRAEQARTSEPKLNDTVFPNQQKPQQRQRGAQKIDQAKTEMQTKAAQPSQAQEKSTPTPSQDKGR